MTKICTDIDQSKKLLELGIDVNTADMKYGYIAPYDYSDRMYDGGYDEIPYPKDFFKKNPNFSENEYDGELPAWSLSALMNLLPSEFTTENKFGKYKYEIKIRKYNLIEDVNLYQIAYGNYKFHEDGNRSWKDMINTGQKEDLLDVCVEMIINLSELKML